MSRGFKRIGWAGATLAMALIALLYASGQKPLSHRGKPIQFSAPRSGVANSNLVQLWARTPLQNSEQDLRKLLNFFRPDDTINDVATAPLRSAPPPRISDKLIKAQSDEKKNWVFSVPEEQSQGPTAAEILKAPEYDDLGVEKQKQTPAEKYYEWQTRRRAGVTNQLKGDRLSGSQDGSDDALAAAADKGPFSSGLSVADRIFRRLSNPDSPNASFREGGWSKGLSDMLGGGADSGNNTFAEQMRAQQERIKEIGQLFAQPAPAAPNAGAGVDLAPPTGPASRFGGLDAFSGRSSESLNSFSAAPGTLLQSAGLPPLATTPGLLPSLTPVLAPPPPRAPLTPPTFSIPKRNF